MTDFIEKIDFGPSYGEQNIIQLPGDEFHSACLQVNSRSNDNTGLRIHGGAHVAIRFLLAHPRLLENLRVCEVGCGTGVYGLVGTRGGSVSSHLVLTDGNARTIGIASENVSNIVAAADMSRVSCRKLLWGSREGVDCFFAAESSGAVPPPRIESERGSLPSSAPQGEDNCSFPESAAAVLSAESVKKIIFFDVVIGCELFYYRTSVEDLLYTVLQLTDSAGIFIHSHVFRRPGQDRELIDYLSPHGWVTVEVPVQLFVQPLELEQHPEWYGVHCLVSGSAQKMDALLERENSSPHLHPSRSSPEKPSAALKWRIFSGVTGKESEDPGPEYPEPSGPDGDDGQAMANLFAMHR